MRKSKFPLSLFALAFVAAVAACGSIYAARQDPNDAAPGAQSSGGQFLDLQLRKACKSLCLEARTAQEVSRCVATRENLQGEGAFKTSHPQCYQAGQSYQAFLDHQRTLNEPERYG